MIFISVFLLVLISGISVMVYSINKALNMKYIGNCPFCNHIISATPLHPVTKCPSCHVPSKLMNGRFYYYRKGEGR